jgi:LytS/YehU family sensor histidine kinase
MTIESPRSDGLSAGQRPDAPSALEPPDTRQTLRSLGRGIVALWWRFFDWLAVVSWKTLLLVALLGLVAAAMMKAVGAYIALFAASAIIKIVAGGKRRADLVARAATQRAQSERLERAAVEARMQALQAQIEPHFLFNTLASIDQLIRSDPPRASRMQQSFIRYLRSAMPQMREGRRPTLGQQVDLSSAFLEIMAMRMEARLQPVIDVPEGLRSAVFPPMMLQTLVENAIKHGLEPKAAGGRLEIKAEIVDGALAVHVIDDGVGFVPTSGDGVGLANIRERLQALYGGRAELVIGVPPAGGTCATVRVPYEIAPATT